MDEFAASAYRRHYGRVYRFVRRRTASAEQAEDVTQEVFEAALAAIAAERLTAEPDLAWLYTVAERRLITTWRRWVHTESFDPESEPGHDRPGGDPYGARISDLLLAGLEQLPTSQRQVVVAKLLRGRPFDQIALSLGISEEACRMRMSRGLAALRAHLRAAGVRP